MGLVMKFSRVLRRCRSSRAYMVHQVSLLRMKKLTFEQVARKLGVTRAVVAGIVRYERVRNNRGYVNE